MAQFGDTSLEAPRPEARVSAATQSGFWVAPRSGYAVVKDVVAGGWLAIASAYHSGTHKHSDELSFELYEQGRRLVQDTGVYHKDHDRFFEFQRSPVAHSTLVVDGRPIDSEQTQPYGSGIMAWGQGDSWYAVWARNPVVRRQGVTHERLFLYHPRYALLVVDSTKSNRPHSYTRYFQLGSKLDVTRQGNTLCCSRLEDSAVL